MADSPRRGFTLASLILALLAAGVAAALAAVYLTSPLDDPMLSSQVAVQASAGDAVFAALVAAALSALVIVSLYAWRPSLRVAVRLTCAALMAIAGIFAALSLDPASADVQSRFGVYAHGEGRDVLLGLFAPWVERMATLSWLYAACGASLLALTLVAALVSHRRDGQQARSVVRAT
jgi:hypothetical protein